jgi:DNA invertase Pin-like site-specific DNA recombinase
MENSSIAYALYRVSTKKQVDVKDDIPMQKQACREYAEANGYVIGREYEEKGVSGFKVSANDRDAINDLKNAAIRGEFQILLVFMFDRLGRIDDETPFVVEWFVKHNIRVISVCEGEQKFESHVDKLMNYIRFWQASGESEKTSTRIKTRMEQLTREGHFTGGYTPFGYSLVHNGRLNKKGDEVFDLAVNPDEAEIVRDMFDKTVCDGYGSHRLATYLNKRGIRTHGGAKFKSNSVIRILRCKLYTGYIVSGAVISPLIEELKIIEDDVFNQAQFILNQRETKNTRNRQIALTTKSKTLLSGIIFCAHCGGRLTSNIYHDTYTRKDGTVVDCEYLRYICYHRSRNLCRCDGQATYSAQCLDKAVNAIVSEVFSNIKDAPDNDMLRKRLSKEAASYKAKQTKISAELGRHYFNSTTVTPVSPSP